MQVVFSENVSASTKVATSIALGSSVDSGNSFALIAFGQDSVQPIVATLKQEGTATTEGLMVLMVPEWAKGGLGFTMQVPAGAFPLGFNPKEVIVTMLDGDSLPNWIRYMPEQNAFIVDGVPDGALPMTVSMKVGRVSVQLVISEEAAAGGVAVVAKAINGSGTSK